MYKCKRRMPRAIPITSLAEARTKSAVGARPYSSPTMSRSEPSNSGWVRRSPYFASQAPDASSSPSSRTNRRATAGRRSSTPSSPAVRRGRAAPRGVRSRPRRSRRGSRAGWARSMMRLLAPRASAMCSTAGIARGLGVDDLGGVLAEPEPVERLRVAAEHEHRAARHSPHLGEPAVDVAPLMHGEGGERGVEGVVVERQLLRRRVDGAGQSGFALGAHGRRGLHRGDVAVARLVRSGAGTDVEHCAGVTQRPQDGRVAMRGSGRR